MYGSIKPRIMLTQPVEGRPTANDLSLTKCVVPKALIVKQDKSKAFNEAISSSFTAVR